mgnify:CR=1 FL=1
MQPIPQKPISPPTFESFNNLPLTEQLHSILDIKDQSQQLTAVRSIASILQEKNFGPNGTSESHYFSLYTKDNKLPLNSSINIERLSLSHKAIEQLANHKYPLEILPIISHMIFEVKYPSDQFESMYKQCLNLKQSNKSNHIHICIFISGINKTDMRFKNDTNIYSIKLDSTVTEIEGGNLPIGMNGGGSFNGCSSLEEVTIPSSVNLIGNFSFSKCTSLTKISLPSSLTSIGNGVFFGCSSLTEITIPSSMKSIGGHCFNGCSKLNHISIPSGVTQIGPLCFNGCSSLTEIEIPSNLEVINANCFKDCSSLVRILIPASVKVISENAFHGCKALKEIQLPTSLESIGESAFSQCSSLMKCFLSSSIKYIHDDAFNGCSSLIDLSLGSSLKSIGKGSFLGCQSLKTLIIPSSVTSIGKGALFGCSSMILISVPDHLKLEETGLNQKVEIRRRNKANMNDMDRKMVFLGSKAPNSTWSNKHIQNVWGKTVTKGWF